jgi:hypothetical protein
MRWNGRERAVGGLAVITTLLAGWLVTDSLRESISRLRPGMTESEVAAALGTPGRPNPRKETCIWLHSPGAFGHDEARYESYVREVFRTNSQFYREYRFPLCTVDVYFRGVRGDERVSAVEARRTFGWTWQFGAWAVIALALGLVAAEAARRSRPPT